MIWILAILWLFLNLIDIIVSWMAIQLGITEVGLFYQFYHITGSFLLTSVLAMVLALSVAIILAHEKMVRGLIVLNSAMFIVVLWNSFVLRQLV